MNKERIIPARWLVLIDLLLILAVLFTFCWFHHIKSLWFGVDSDLDSNNPSFTKVNDSTQTEPIIREDGYDYSGDFGNKFGNMFLKEGEEVISTDTTYKSHDVSVTLKEVNTTMDYQGKSYTVQYFVYDIYVRNIENFYTVAVANRRPLADLIELGGQLQDEEGVSLKDGIPIAAVNGDYWGNENHTEVAVRNGKVLRTSEYISSDICVLYFNGVMETISPSEYDWDVISAKSPYQIWEFGPALLDGYGNMITEYSNDSFDHNVVDQRHPRSSIGYYEPGHYCLVVVDGRSDDSQGVRMIQLAEIYASLGCQVAYNFDGGDSCQAYFNGEVYRVDQEREENGEIQRSLYDIVCVGEVRSEDE